MPTESSSMGWILYIQWLAFRPLGVIRHGFSLPLQAGQRQAARSNTVCPGSTVAPSSRSKRSNEQ